MSEIYCPTRKLVWEEVSLLIQNKIEAILGHFVSCKAWMEDLSYWSVSAENYQFPIEEFEKLLQSVQANSEVRLESFPEEMTASRSLGMGLSQLLLHSALCADWEQELYTEDALWLVNYKCNENLQQTNIFHLPGASVRWEELKSYQELMAYMKKNGSTHSALMDFCEPYRKRYHNELCWPYPISDGKHLGIFLIPVREGILSLPYDEADKEDYEIFCLEDARMADAAAMEIFIEDWANFSQGLQSAMKSMLDFYKRKEKDNGTET